jgi:putative tryptophan/tyrosine transport system substrate-binding protein
VHHEDPVRLGLVASLARPGRNATGTNFFSGELTGKRLEFLCELVPAAKRVAVFVNPANGTTAETTLRDVEPAARAMGLQIQVFNTGNSREINAAFATFERAARRVARSNRRLTSRLRSSLLPATIARMKC